MSLIYIENKKLLTKIISYLDYQNIEYTTDINIKTQTIIVAQYNKKTLELIKNFKRVIFIAYLEEFKIYNNFSKKNKKSNLYKNRMNDFFSKCNIVVTSLPYFKKVIKTKKIIVIPTENLCNCICKNKLFSRNKKSIIIVDSNYKYLESIFNLINKYPEYNYKIIGYRINLNKNDKIYLNDLPKNVELYKYCDDRIYQTYINDSNLIIFFDNIIESFSYLNISLNLKKNILLLNSDLCNDYFVDNKNIYLFNLKTLDKKFNKYIKDRVSKLNLESFNLIKDNDFINISDKFCKILK